MPKFSLQVSAQLTNVTSIKPPDEYPWHLVLQCTSCGEKTSKPVVVSTSDEVEGIRKGVVSLKLTCKLCGRVNDVKLLQQGAYTEEASPDWAEILSLECRGLQPLEWIVADDVPMEITSLNGPLEDGIIEDGEFYGFDEKLGEEANVTELTSKFEKV
ncbi:hypothetical protein BWQ96_01837 [Gracilariopsis chorda]|uniref:Uncharacterized protein n=1 Tax=Gracilariopsis chorda TaxID=448386 RepID=A0A2V3J308_9FLOR|nr:hypothetical protein BWQ96_01837 [Gracilariopsis chorda]|eukprot:PXF48377.1 hypothetical protein BWQ96_01837 [Gracilariopsis chorda]